MKPPDSSEDTALPETNIAARVLLSDTGSAPEPGAAPITDADRVKAYNTAYVWNGIVLEPFTIGREGLFNVVRAFLPLGFRPLPDTYEPIYLLDAILLLFICTAPPEALSKIRHQADLVIDAANEWAQQHIPRDRANAAGVIAFTVLRDNTLTTAVPRPEGGTSRGSGN